MHSKPIFTLSHFEGPLDFLLSLIHKEEIGIQEVSCQELTRQFLAGDDVGLENGPDFVAWAATLMWLKSRALLPVHEQASGLNEEEDLNLSFEAIPHLIDYCLFKQAAKSLVDREDQQSQYFARGCGQFELPGKPLGGLDHLSVQDLAALFQEVLTKSVHHVGTIQEETIRVSDKIALIRSLISRMQQVGFYTLFEMQKTKLELIVTFLALLELMKLGEVRVVRDSKSEEVMIIMREQ